MDSAEKERAYGAMPVQLWTAAPTGELDYVNRAVVDYFAIDAERLLRDGWRDVCHPLDLTTAWVRWQQSLATGAPYEVAFRLRGSDQRYRWHISRAVAVRDDSGTVQYWIGTNSEVDELKRAEELSRATMERNRGDRDRVRKLFDGLPLAVVITAGPGHFVETCNDAARKLATTSEIVGTPLKRNFPALNAARVRTGDQSPPAASTSIDATIAGTSYHLYLHELQDDDGATECTVFVLCPAVSSTPRTSP